MCILLYFSERYPRHFVCKSIYGGHLTQFQFTFIVGLFLFFCFQRLPNFPTPQSVLEFDRSRKGALLRQMQVQVGAGEPVLIWFGSCCSNMCQDVGPDRISRWINSASAPPALHLDLTSHYSSS